MESFVHCTRRMIAYVLGGVAARTGVYVGVSLSVVFTAWLLIANRLPALEPLAVPRNIVAACLLGAIGGIPVLRFLRAPSEMWLSTVIAWGIFTLTYGILCWQFPMLDQYYSTFEVFVLGAVVYLLLATLSWVGTIVWRVRVHRSQARH
jgi:hypothetical protein